MTGTSGTRLLGRKLPLEMLSIVLEYEYKSATSM